MPADRDPTDDESMIPPEVTEPTTDRAELRRRRDLGQRLFDVLAGAYDGVPGVDRSAMFGSEALRTASKVFGFVGREGELIVKLPAGRVAAEIADHGAEPVNVGRNPAREWVSVPFPTTTADRARWVSLLAESHEFVTAQQTGRPR